MILEFASRSYASKAGQSGTSLIEVMVASLILGLTVLGVVAMYRKGLELSDSGNIFRQARNLAYASLEDSAKFQYSAYPAPIGTHTLTLNQSIYLSPDHLLLPVVEVVVSDSIITEIWDGSPVPYQRVEAIVRWTYNGQDHSARAVKRITKAR